MCDETVYVPAERSKMAKRKSNGEGSIRQLPSGSWQIQMMDGYKTDGTRNYKTFTAPKLEEAKKKKKKRFEAKDWLFMN